MFHRIFAAHVFPRLLPILLITFFPLASQAEDAYFAWSPNTEANLAGYKIYYGTASRNYTDSINVGNPQPVDGRVTATLSGFTAGNTYYFSATAYDTDGVESDYSTEVVWTVPGTVASPPTASDTVLTIAEDTVGSGQLAGVSQDGSALTYQLVTNGLLGSAVMLDSAAGTFSYTPSANAYGRDSFSYKVSDANGESNIATVTVTIQPVNDIPAAAAAQLTTNEDQPISGKLVGRDADGDSLTYALTSNATMGQVVLTDAATGAFTYTPAADKSGTASFTFKVNDGAADSNIAMVTITVKAVNDAPVAEDGVLSVNENEVATGDLVATDTDSGSMTYSIISNPVLGQVTILDPATGAYRYTPADGEFGEDVFQFAATDDQGAQSNVATVTVSIAQPPDALALEMKTVTVDSKWSVVTFSKPFVDPVVVAKQASNNDPDPCVVRIRNLTPAGFEIRLQNWDYLPDDHAAEQVSFLALERGTHVLADGTMIEAGSFAAKKVGTFVPVILSKPFHLIPVVTTSIITSNEADAVVGRIRRVSNTGFEYTLQEQEINRKLHAMESVAYVVWEPSSGSINGRAYEVNRTANSVTSNPGGALDLTVGFTETPPMLVDMQTAYGLDTALARIDNCLPDGCSVWIAEEQSKDAEMNHANEVVGYMAISP